MTVSCVENYCKNVDAIIDLAEKYADKFNVRKPGEKYNFSTAYGDSRLKSMFRWNMPEDLKKLVYESLPEEDKKLYLQNNCNLHLDTTTELEDFGRLRMRCGDGGAIRILLFMYIYKVITNRYGCDGNTIISILYYLKTPFQEIFTPKLNALLLPIFNSAPKDFSVSAIPMNEFKTYAYKSLLHEYLKKYYAYVQKFKQFLKRMSIKKYKKSGAS
jgi:hypothetical protein